MAKKIKKQKQILTAHEQLEEIKESLLYSNWTDTTSKEDQKEIINYFDSINKLIKVVDDFVNDDKWRA